MCSGSSSCTVDSQLHTFNCIFCLILIFLKALTASGLSGLRWTLAQILTQKQELGRSLSILMKVIMKKHTFFLHFYS